MDRELNEATRPPAAPHEVQSRPESTADLYLSEEGRALVARMAALARGKFAPRAAGYDEAAAFPHEDFDDLRAEGLHAPTVPLQYGGLGLGPYRGDAFTLWMLTKEIAKRDLSLARCWEGHANSLVLIDGLGNEEQRTRWFGGVVERGEKWVAWSGEPQSPALGERARFGTTLERADGGWIVSGSKAFCTSAGGADWAILLVNASGPGGARHATASPESLYLLACDLHDPSIALDASWWNPIGMRATVSYGVRFNDTFIPDANVIGAPGRYLREGWQTCFAPHYAAAFLGAAELALEYALDYIRVQNKGEDPYVQHHIAQIAIGVETAHLWLRHVALLWQSGLIDQAQIAGSRARHLVEHIAEEAVQHAVRACGARSLNRPSALERTLRDLSLYIRHDNDDQVLATVGRSVLGRAFDTSFYRP
ncbi:MAG TPA: acyl-CoA dehydrogenase family protein [Thermoanaerobaculia bacterium]|nr:acyl-CoA dehydrogenase family protein [Thermoanaerobaculia bacterium]